MTWFGWWLIGLLVVRTLLTINLIGKLRTIVTPNEKIGRASCRERVLTDV